MEERNNDNNPERESELEREIRHGLQSGFFELGGSDTAELVEIAVRLLPHTVAQEGLVSAFTLKKKLDFCYLVDVETLPRIVAPLLQVIAAMPDIVKLTVENMTENILESLPSIFRPRSLESLHVFFWFAKQTMTRHRS